MNILSIAVLIVILIWFVAAVRYMIKHKGSALGCSSCSGSCRSCCEHSSCHKDNKK